MKDVVTIIERWYCNRVERYVVMGDGSLLPLEVWKSDPFVLWPGVSTEQKKAIAAGNVEG